MNAVPNMPLTVDTPPAAKNCGAGREGSTAPVEEQPPADFKTTLQEVNAQGQIERDAAAPVAREQQSPVGDDIPDVRTGAEASKESAEAVAGAVVVAIDSPRQSHAIGRVGRLALPADDSTAIAPAENGRAASHLTPNVLPGESQEATRAALEAKPSPALAASLATAPAAEDDSAGSPAEPAQSPGTTRQANFRPPATEVKADAVQGRLSSAETLKSLEDSPAAPPASREEVQALKNGNPIKSAVDSVPEATATPPAAATRASANDRRPIDAFEGRVRSDGPTQAQESLEDNGTATLPKDTPPAVQRLVQTARPDVEQRPEGLSGFERVAAAPGEKTAQAPAPERPLPPTPEGFRHNNLASIVERVAVTVRGHQSEARIALKPEHLGSLRVQISTDNNMVSIKIMTEFPMARDLLESSLPQLRAELQQQGLQVEEFDVSFEEEKQHFRRGERRARDGRSGNRISGQVAEEETHAADEIKPEIRRGAAERSPGIDYFA
ncbi:MAG: flagellar hook-length control protein FliK [Desulfobacterales bacterium]|nr:flagellar hook-length control protein FliK [Desulfobacterales bacterium]